MSTEEEKYSGKVIGCDVGDVTLQIHLPCDEDDEETDDDFSDSRQPLLLATPSSNHVTTQSGTNGRLLTRRQMSIPTNLTSSAGTSNGKIVPYAIRPPPIVRRQTLPSKLLPFITTIPGEVTLTETTYDISENSPTQINISWKPPTNCNEIPNLVYEMQLQKETNGDWMDLSERNIAVVRVYTTETKFILDGVKRSFSEGPCSWRLRIRGVNKGPECRCDGPWSNIITLDILTSCDTSLDGGAA